MPGPGPYRKRQIRSSVRRRPRPKFPEQGDLKIGRQPSAATPMNPAGLNSLRPKRRPKRGR